MYKLLHLFCLTIIKIPLIYFTTVPCYHSDEYQGILFCLSIGKQTNKQTNKQQQQQQQQKTQAFFTLQLSAFKQNN